MFKTNKSPTKSQAKQNKSGSNELALLISRMQKNADQVERNILETQKKLSQDANNCQQKKNFQFQEENAKNLKESEFLLKDLFLDVDKARQMKHPQCEEISKDIQQLHERVSQECTEYREIYEKFSIPSIEPKVDWPQVLNQKKAEIERGQYGPGLPDVEQQVAEHNILQQEIEEYGPQIQQLYTPDTATVKHQYKDLLETSNQRSRNLGSLYNHLHSCTKELVYLNDQQRKILKQDWSDQMHDTTDVRRQYENFKTNDLLAQEDFVNNLQDDGDRMIELKHPAVESIQTHQDAIKNEWQNFLNLCICQESHLKNAENYKKFQEDADAVSQCLKKVNSNLDTNYSKDAPGATSDLLRQLEKDEKTINQAEKDIANLKKRSLEIPPLKLRRTHLSQPITVDTMCDWDSGDMQLSKGEKYILNDNSDPENWVVQSKQGETKNAPAACFFIPPPDSECTDHLKSLEGEMNEVKKKQTVMQNALKSNDQESRRSNQRAPAGDRMGDTTRGQADDLEGNNLLSRLNKINGDLGQMEQEILRRVRTPVNNNQPSDDIVNRLREQEGTTKRLQNIGAEKDGAQRECEAFLSKKPSGPSAMQLPTTLNNVKNKYNDVKALSSLYDDEAKASLNLENQIKKTDQIISGFEAKLVQDSFVQVSQTALQDRASDIQKMKRDLVDKQDNLLTMNRSLKDTELASSTMQNNFQEYAPDMPRQKAAVQRLNERYHAVADQLDQREKMLRDTNLTYQQFRSADDNMSSWLNNLPRNQVKSTDGPSQINYKLQSQKRLVDEIQRKDLEKNSMVKLSHDIQSSLNDYEAEAERYRLTLDPNLSASAAKKPRITPLQQNVEAQEKDLVKRYTEAAVENRQQLNQLQFASKVLEKTDVVNGVPMANQQNFRSENASRSTRESEALQSQLKEEQDKVADVQRTLEDHRTQLLLLKTKRPIERLEEKEVVQYYREPKLESSVSALKNQVENEYRQREITQSEIEGVTKKIIQLENQRKIKKPQLLTKEVTQIDRDPELDNQASMLSHDIKLLREENSSLSTELERLKREVLILEQKQPNIKEKVVVKEVVKLERDPEMVKATRTLQMQVDDEKFKRKSVEENIIKLRNRTDELERLIESVEPKVIVKEVKKVEQDPELLKECARLRTLIDEEKSKSSTLIRELTELQTKHTVTEKQKPKVEIKEVVNEIFQVDPETEKEIVHLKREIQNVSSKRTNYEKEVGVTFNELNVVRSQKPAVEYKEVVQEVVKLEKSPENIREIDRLKQQRNELMTTSNRYQEQLTKLRVDRDEWKRERSKVETKLVNKELIKYENDPLLEKEAEHLRQEVRNESQRRREVEDVVYNLQNKYMLLERRKPEEKLVVQEVVLLQKDPKLREEHNRLQLNLDEETGNRRRTEREVQQLRAMVEEKEKMLNFQEERNKKLAAEKELRKITLRIKEIEESPPPVQEKIVMEEVVKVEIDPVLEKSANTLRLDLDKERNQISNLQREYKNLQAKIDILQREKSMEKTIYKEVIRVEKDKILENERVRVRELYNKERNSRQDAEEEIRRLKDKIERAENMQRTWSREESDLQRARNLALQEKSFLETELRELGRQKQQNTVFLSKESELLTQRTENDRQKRAQLGHELSSLEGEILKEKDQIYEKERTIREFQSKVNREEINQETQLRETNVSTKISILDPDTGLDMSPYEAYRKGIIDRNQYIQLQELECDWEEISTMGSSGEISVLLDKKSGKQYSIEDALRAKRITRDELQQYKDGKIPISEFALLVAGETKHSSLSIGSIISSKSPLSSPTSPNANFFSYSSSKNFYDDSFPIAGVYDNTTDTKCTIRNAVAKNMVDPITAQKLLEAQAATGGIIDINTKDRYSVNKAIDRGLIDNTNTQRLFNAQKAFTGVEDPVTKKRLSVGEAMQKGWMTKETALPYLEVQHLTGGLIDPKKTGRIPVSDAVMTHMLDDNTAKTLQDELQYDKGLTDPITNEKMNYKEAIARCRRDPTTGLLFLPAASQGYQPGSYRPVNVSPGLQPLRY
uniref:Envoplakin n=1 Tax=Geotrypetes seraphini TaxID=260995 RepID=A0A6P8SGV6_GEOSA|nr:envoplakin [Geotrypetes seraphini]XP_033817797.1 envoplakin [Geotrypetes seraphini]XP_033817798.1 envoplakin [Geotrypetes seraphini]XP_033817799.1 envoplakin [Geotrypetes seraphini]XP_033817800.1 envoplakin [Geotrypetes seraphini]